MTRQAAARLLIMSICVPLIALDIIVAQRLPLTNAALAAFMAFVIATMIVLFVMRAVNKLFSL
ncbi:MAG: hypothetical protein JOZ84_09280 [Methylobacteriaceae bacterium]|nr:hypothetical protein [Methylobacteriaceae bacterium]